MKPVALTTTLLITVTIVGALLCHGIGVRGESSSIASKPTPTPSNDNSIISNVNSIDGRRSSRTVENAAVNGSTIEPITGIAVCDRYILKYEACLKEIALSAPQAMPSLNQAFEAQRNAFKVAASKPGNRKKLTKICEQSTQTVKMAAAEWCTDW